MSSTIPDDLYRIRHSAAHVLAQAVLERFPQAKLGIGPPTATGFYYDFDLGTDDAGRNLTFTPDDLKMLESRMREIVKARLPFERRVVSKSEALTLFASQPFKVELITELSQGTVDEDARELETAVADELTTYRQGAFEDLCRGPHVAHTGMIPVNAFQLLNSTGAYWRGSEANPSLQRIYGTAWRTKDELQAYLESVEAAKRRDHRKLGKDLELFTFEDEVGPGLPLWLPRGAIIIEELERLAKEVETREGYDRVRTPHLSKEDLFLRSGHLPYYAESMFPPMELDNVVYYLKPMNCPFHHKIFAAKPRSYRDLPIRLAEYGTCYRYEKSGELFGVMRTRSLQMNDAHIYCSEEQFEQEFLAVIRMYLGYFELLGIDKYMMRLSTHHRRGLGKKYVDNERLWLHTEGMVRGVLERANVPFTEVSDEAAFYGPKIDVQIWSAIGREFTLATNQVDFAVPARFDLKYNDKTGTEQTPLCIHRAPLSTHERMVGFLLEHLEGNLPIWLSPEQVRIIPITDDVLDYARAIEHALRAANVRVSTDDASTRMNAKIRAAQLLKIPYMVIIGAKEKERQRLTLRLRSAAQEDVDLAGLLDRIVDRIATRSSAL